MKLGRCMTALITPMMETGELDLTALSNLVEKLIAEGCDGFVVCGTTAEVSALSREEKQQALRCVLKQSEGRVCVWMGCGTNNTAETLDLIRWINTEPVDGIMLVCPYYVRPSNKDCMPILRRAPASVRNRSCFTMYPSAPAYP